MLRRFWLIALFAVGACGPSATQQPRPKTAVVAAPEAIPPKAGPEAKPKLPSAIARSATPPAVEKAWSALPGSKNDCPNEFDYFPAGGMRIFYCHVRPHLGYKLLQDLAGVAAFTTGPHTRDTLDLKSTKAFGHYNPAFVRWLADHLIPGPSLRDKTQPIYDKQVKPLARIFYVAHRKLQTTAGAKYLTREKAHYLKQVNSGSVSPSYYEKYFWFMNPGYFKNPDGNFDYFHRRGFDGGVNGNVVKTCAAFWVRRSIDGTHADFAAALERLLAAYDNDFLEKAKKHKGPSWSQLVGM